MVKVSFILIAFQADAVLEPCLRSVEPFGDVYAAEGPVQFWQNHGYTTSTDQTNAILNRLHIPTVHGQWSEKTDEANAALALAPHDTDFVFCLDADEIWNASTLAAIFKELDTGSVDSMSFKALSFYGGFDRVMTGFEEEFEVHRVMRYGPRFTTHRPPTILAPDGRPWRDHRHLDHNATSARGLRFYHYSYVFPSQMEMKARYYAEMGGNIPDYFDSVYLPWVMGGDAEKARIESLYDGVHNWLPVRRGRCYTRRYEGVHPAEIQRIMPDLKRRFDCEMGMTNEC